MCWNSRKIAYLWNEMHILYRRWPVSYEMSWPWDCELGWSLIVKWADSCCWQSSASVCCRVHMRRLRRLDSWYRSRSPWYRCQRWTRAKTRPTKPLSRWAGTSSCTQLLVSTLLILPLSAVLTVYFCRASYANAVLGVVILSVRLSIRHTRALWLIQRTYRRYFYTTWKGNPSSQMWFFVQLCNVQQLTRFQLT